MLKTPVFQLYKGDEDLMATMAPYFLGASFTDQVGRENDELQVFLNDEHRQLPLPREGDLLYARAGYRETGVKQLGAFKIEKYGLGWQPGGAEAMVMTARAVAFTGPVKAGGTRHFDDMTLADILGETAKSAGLTLAIDPELAQIRIPYALRWETSPIDFASRLAAEHGGVVKPGGERLAITRKGSGRDAGGNELPRIRVSRVGSGGWNIEGEPRPRQGTVAAAYQDPQTGRRQLASESTGQDGPVHNLIHPRATKAEAEAAAAAQARDLNMQTGAGFFVVEFDPAYSAGAIVEATGFGEGIDGTWPSERISTSWEKGSPVMSTIDVTAEAEGGQDNE